MQLRNWKGSFQVLRTENPPWSGLTKREKCSDVRWAGVCFGPEFQGVIWTMTSFLSNFLRSAIFCVLVLRRACLITVKLAATESELIPTHHKWVWEGEESIFSPAFQGNVLRFIPLGQLDQFGSCINPGVNLWGQRDGIHWLASLRSHVPCL